MSSNVLDCLVLVMDGKLVGDNPAGLPQSTILVYPRKSNPPQVPYYDCLAVVKAKFPSALCVYVNKHVPDLEFALKKGKTDAGATGEPQPPIPPAPPAPGATGEPDPDDDSKKASPKGRRK